jgi:Acyl-CoA reductase (LuxC)
MTTADEIGAAAARIRHSVDRPLAPARIVSALARACESWRDRAFDARLRTLERIAERYGFSMALLDESIDALLAPFTAEKLAEMAARVPQRRQVAGFVMAGNIAGAGLHELAATVLAGAGAIIKTATAEPRFFPAFGATLAEIDGEVGARLAVFNWRREHADLTSRLIAESDFTVAYGDDATIAALSTAGARLFGFGSRLSIAVVGAESLDAQRARQVAAALARDVALFEQLGCLSPHQVFVEEGHGGISPREFAAALADALDDIAHALPAPARLWLQDAAAVRRVRETARWRSIAGEEVELFEGRELSWTVVFDAPAPLTVSPGFRTVQVSAYPAAENLRARLAPARGAIEACALSDPAPDGDARVALARDLAIPLVCAAGTMQSPPLLWRHGGGKFIDFLMQAP